MTTNITENDQNTFTAIKHASNIALYSCFVNGKPAVAIVSVNGSGENVRITPLYVSITDDMVITNHEGEVA